ncbi:shikimate O-hydroxycinnamoyltransferase-like [Rutidosis leptorrhynchoides]|uniref:shikimate O-hydroxycinnamoyltransferase-like n=1 Tax=Rutidosis leptorrhynchoides TaxID=125765 RepID=UPI003A994BA5
MSPLVTYFKCGGVSLGVGMHHYVADASSAGHFIKAWSDMARGLDLTIHPFLDRTLLLARDPPRPVYEHIDYKNAPLINSSPVSTANEIVVSIFKITREQLNLLKAISKKEGNTINFSSFEILSAHIWKCVCEARGLPDDEKTALYLVTDGRARLQPALPPGFFGNVSFLTASRAVAGEIKANPIWYAASIIHDALVKMNDDYLKSTIDYLEVQHDIKDVVASLVQSFTAGSNLGINSWVNLPSYEVDFGWGRPIFVGPGDAAVDGTTFVSRGPVNDGSLSVVIWLKPQHMEIFKKLFYLLPSKL